MKTVYSHFSHHVFVAALTLILGQTSQALTLAEYSDVIARFKQVTTPLYARHHLKLMEITLNPPTQEYSFNTYATSSSPLEHGQRGISVEATDQALQDLDVPTFLTYLCHEAGHHLGASPFKPYATSEWPKIKYSAEGQADYWSAANCLPLFVDQTPANTEWAPKAESKCREFGAGQLESAIKRCTNIVFFRLHKMYFDYYEDALQAAPTVAPTNSDIVKSVLELLSTKNDPIEGIQTSYPSESCRLETYVSGALKIDRPKCWYNP